MWGQGLPAGRAARSLAAPALVSWPADVEMNTQQDNPTSAASQQLVNALLCTASQTQETWSSTCLQLSMSHDGVPLLAQVRQAPDIREVRPKELVFLLLSANSRARSGALPYKTHEV